MLVGTQPSILVAMTLPGSTRRMLPCLLAGAVVAAASADSPRAVRGSAASLQLIYVGAGDCAPCLRWRAAHWSALHHAAVFAPVRFVEIHAPRAADLLRDEHWPRALQQFRPALPRDAAVPLWLLVRDDALVGRAWGEQGWRETMLPALRRAVAGDGMTEASSGKGYPA